MRLKRVYDHNAPQLAWGERKESCETCKAKGKVVNETLDGVVDCPDCLGGVRHIPVPPVMGVVVQHAGPKQNFSPNFVEGGQEEGWLSVHRKNLTIKATNGDWVYEIMRRPGRYGAESIAHYECQLISGGTDG